MPALICILLLNAVITANSGALPETVIGVTDSLPHGITSPDFPKCCKPMQYILKKEVNRKYLKLLFTDLDLLPTSQLLIYGLEANGTKVPLDSARYFSGESWIRPVVLYEGKQMLIEFHTTENKVTTSKFVGFNGTFWADNDPWELDKPLTYCPPIGRVLTGGRVSFENVEPPLGRQHYRLYCVWQLKPIPDSDLSIYVNIEKLSGVDSKLEIRNGVTSSSPVIHSSSEVNSPLKLTSTDGFYIKLTRPLEDGDFTLTHGVFKSTSSSGNCSFKVDGKSVDGFRCGEGDDAICIPVENKCNAIRDCPEGLDELPRTCVKPTTTLAPTVPGTTLEPCPRGRCLDGRCPKTYHERCPEDKCSNFRKRCEGTLLCVKEYYENCPGEPCTSSQKTCADGTCVRYSSGCPDGSRACSFTEKRCKNGYCYSSWETCPGEECPSSMPFRCDGVCHYESAKCDGIRDCSDRQDEQGCSFFSGASKPLLWLLLIIPAVFVFVMCGYCNSKERRDRSGSNETQRIVLQQRSNFTSPPRISGAGVSTRPTTRTTTSSTNRNDNTTTLLTNGGEANNDSVQPDTPTPSAPPSYNDVMDNRETYVAPPEAPPPDYSSVSANADA